jgi:glucose/arabinose dehydrogenase
VSTAPAAPPTTPTPVRREPPKLALRQVVDGLSQPTFVTHAGDGTGRLFVVEKAGRIRIVAGGTIQPQPFLDITDRVGSAGSEQGLFSVAFHPQYRANGLFFVDYTDQNGNTMISRFHISSDPNRADPSSETTVLTVDQPEANHNGGQLAFGPNGYLYIGMGDGGGAGDRHGRQGNGQNGAALLGKILRIDVNGKAPYAIPPDNPFAGQAGMRPEIWATGVRNPWRFSFDRATGDLFIADVGQDRVEEVDFQPAHSRGGQNYGWRIMEGSECFNPSTGCSKSNLTLPVAEYSHDFGCTIIGGYRYRGKKIPTLDGIYLFGDYCSGRIWALTGDAQAGWTKTEVLQTKYSISSFGEDENGELYLLDLAGGGLYRFEAQ